ncbi:MAG: S49 family peptidase [Ignavibacteriales bacterium]|nr:S49 family peptidase [Ignavibacteriales bacterium]
MNKSKRNIFKNKLMISILIFVDRFQEVGNMTFEVDEIAQGRIWSGIDAKNIGLVDTLGVWI